MLSKSKALLLPSKDSVAWFIDFWRRVLKVTRPVPKALHLRANLALGERRFIAVVEFEEARFLVGGTSSSLVLLSRLGNEDPQAHLVASCETGRIENRERIIRRQNKSAESTQEQNMPHENLEILRGIQC